MLSVALSQGLRLRYFRCRSWSGRDNVERTPKDPAVLTAEGTLPRCSCRMPGRGGCQGLPWCPVLLGLTPQAAPRVSCLLLSVVAHSAMG